MEKINERAEFNNPYVIEDWINNAKKITFKELIDTTQREFYIKGATEQKAIDIEWLNTNCRGLISAEIRQDFRKAMVE